MHRNTPSIPGRLSRGMVAICLGPLTAMLLLAARSALAQGSELTSILVAAKGDQIGAKAGDAVLSVAGPAVIDDAGDVAFHFIVTGANAKAGSGSGVVFYKGGTTPQILAQTGPDANHPTAPAFTKLSDPVMSSPGTLAFVGKLKAGLSGVFVSKNGTANLVAATGGDAPGMIGAKFKTFMNVGVNDAGGVVLLAAVSEPAQSPALFAADQSGALQAIAHKGQMFNFFAGPAPITGITAFKPLPVVGGQSRTLDESSGSVTALIHGAHGLAAVLSALLAHDGFTVSTTAATGDALGSDGIRSIGEPALNGGSLAYSVLLAGGDVTAANKSGFSYGSSFLREGSFAPDATGTPTAAIFAKTSDPVINNNGQIAFLGTLKAGVGGVTAKDAHGIWSNSNGALQQIVREGDSAPGSSGTFASFKQIVLPDVVGVVFQATLRGVPASENQGVWVSTSSGLLPAIITGQKLELHGTLKTVRKIGIFQQASIVLGQNRSFDASTCNLVYQATFTDGTWGIYEIFL